MLLSSSGALAHDGGAYDAGESTPLTGARCAHVHGRVVLRSQIFDRQGQPLYYREFNRPLAAAKDEHKLMYGFLFSLKKLVASLSPKAYALPGRVAPPMSGRVKEVY